MSSGVVVLVVAVLAAALAVTLARLKRPEPGSAAYERNDPLRVLHETTDEALRGLGHDPAWRVTAPGTRAACCERCSGGIILTVRGDGSGAVAQAYPPVGTLSELHRCPGAVTVLPAVTGAVALAPAVHAAVVPGIAAGVWGLALLWCLVWLAGRHWITAWLFACVLLAAAWGFILSLAFGPADLAWGWDPAKWAGYARHDAGLVLTWADPLKPWQLCAVIGGLGAWCKLVRSLHKAHDRRVIRRAGARQAPQVPVVPVAWIGGPDR